MNLDFCTFNANIISRSLAYIEINTDDPDVSCVYLATRNQYILDIFGIFDYPFKHYNVDTKQIQAVDVRTNESVIINLEKINTIIIYGDAELLSPPIVGNPIFFETLNEKDIADIQLPFCARTLADRDSGCFADAYTRKSNIESEVLKFKSFSKEVNLISGDPFMRYYLEDEFHNKCNSKLWRYVQDHKKHVLFASYAFVLRQCAEKTGEQDIKLETFEDVQVFFSDVQKVRQIWCTYLKTLIEKQIAKLNSEFEEVCSLYFANDTQAVERDFIKIQYENTISNLKKINIDTEVEKFGDNVFLLLRYIPSDVDIPTELAGIAMFSPYENEIFHTLFKNNIVIDESLFDFTGIDRLWWTYGAMLGLSNLKTIPVIEQLNNLYLEKMKEARMEQIKQHSNDIVEMVRQEAGDLDEEDIAEIISSMQDFDTFKERIDSFTNIVDIIQYWPSVLLPLPPYVVRLSGLTRHAVDLHNLIATNS
jgi:hypothetical protein